MQFREGFLELAQTRTKESFSLDILKKFQTENVSEGTLDTGILLILHSVLVPTARRIIKKPNNKKIGVKVTIADSRNSFYIQFATSGELETAIQDQIDIQLKNKDCLQPIICGIGPSVLEANEFFVYFADIFYKFESIIAAVEACFKIFYVLNLKYPESCKLVWLFIQEFFFNFPIPGCDMHPSVKSLANDLKKN
ncbi:uncharacterized protein [Drosophila takahashii]|uniref:uncharacterized protein n=1 Tax=Drosophila takahashii TaxID=29030 RepID=UPI0038992D8E